MRVSTPRTDKDMQILFPSQHETPLNETGAVTSSTAPDRQRFKTSCRTSLAGRLIGSLAKASVNRTLSKALVKLAPQELELAEIPFRHLPIYSYDYDDNFP